MQVYYVVQVWPMKEEPPRLKAIWDMKTNDIGACCVRMGEELGTWNSYSKSVYLYSQVPPHLYLQRGGEINFCPWCGEKIECVESKKVKMIRKETATTVIEERYDEEEIT